MPIDKLAETKPAEIISHSSQNQLSPSDQSQHVTAIRDPFGNSYGYSTAKAANPSGTVGYNPTFDLWSSAGATAGPPNQVQWIKNW